MAEILQNPHPITSTDTRGNRTGTWRAFRPVYVQLTSPCREACPAGEDIARWIDLVRAKEYQAAWEILTEDNPFPATLGRICPHPCTEGCNRGQHDQSVNIHGLEQFLGDRGLTEGWAFAAPETERQAQVAVVGGGAAGLSCAYQLRRLGYQVTIFEAAAEVGGNLASVLPENQLPAQIIRAEIQRVLDLGVTVRTGVRVGSEVTWEKLRGEYAAVFLAIGAHSTASPVIPGQELPGVQSGLQFLAEIRAGRLESLGKSAVVVGAGATGIESARSLRRLGIPVTLVTAATLDPATLPKKLAAALSEGVALKSGAEAEAILGDSRVTGIRAGGQEIPADLVILATGRSPDLESVPDDAEVDANFNLAADPFTGMTAMAGIFAGGDLTGTRMAAEAVGAGKRAAASIHAYLQGEDAALALGAARLGHSPNLAMRAFTRPQSYPPQVQVNLQRVVAYADIETLYFPRIPSQAHRSSLTEEQALAETNRCFSCGTCIGCDNCYVFCPDVAISRRPDGLGYSVDLNYCKGCGICVSECPREALVLEEEVK